MSSSRILPLPSTGAILAIASLCLSLTGAERRAEPGQSSSLATAQQDRLSPGQRAWIRAHGAISIDPSLDYYPLDFVDEHGQWRGYAADVFELLEERLDIQFKIIKYSNREHEPGALRPYADLVPLTATTNSRRLLWDYTEPYLETPVVVLARRDHDLAIELDSLAGLQVGVVAEWAVETFVREQRPQAIVRPVSDTATGLRLVADGELDVMLSDLPVATWEMYRSGIANLSIVGDAGYSYDLSVGVRRSLPELKSIVEKGLATISPLEHRQLLDRWVNLEREQRWFDRAAIWITLAALASLLAAGSLGTWFWNRSLRRQVAERTAEIVQRHAELVELERDRHALRESLQSAQRMDALGRIAGGIAHDFNNVLACVSGFTFLARQAIAPDSPAIDSLEEILRASDRARDLVRQILTFGRPTTGEISVFDVSDVVHEATTLLRASLPAGIELIEHNSSRNLAVKGDASQIHQIVLNLGTNAAHAMGAQGQLSISCSELHVQDPEAPPPALQPGAYVCLSVQDDGCGMSAEAVTHAFDPFFTTKKLGEGTGLGLAVVHGIVTAHGGSVQIQSKAGVGTVVSVMLPRSSESPLHASEDAHDPEGQERVLVVDDQPQVLKVLVRTLERRGYAVTRFGDPLKALAALRANPEAFDLIITDEDMPGLTGTDLASAAQQLRSALPVILITGYGQQVDPRSAEHAQIVEVMSKPFSAPQLARAARRALDRGQAQPAL